MLFHLKRYINDLTFEKKHSENLMLHYLGHHNNILKNETSNT